MRISQVKLIAVVGILVMAGMVLSVAILTGPSPVHAAPEGAKAGDVCAVSKDGEGNVYESTYESRGQAPDRKLVCNTANGRKVGQEAPGATPGETYDVYATTVARVFPTPVINNPVGSSDTPRVERPAPTPVPGCTEAEIEAAGNTKQYGHAHPGGGTNSLTGFMTRAQACGHGIYHQKVWSNNKPNVHNHFWGENGGFQHSH